jgi:predicted CoA-binding protein
MSDKTVAQKLLIKENYKVLFINEPNNYASILGELPKNTTMMTEPSKAVDFIQFFVTSNKELKEGLIKLKPHINPKVLLWVTYPKGTSKIKTDVNRDIIRKYAQTIGLTSVAMISVNDIWSALRLKLSG